MVFHRQRLSRSVSRVLPSLTCSAALLTLGWPAQAAVFPALETPPPQTAAPVVDQVTLLRNAIIGQESGANFRAVNPHSGALGYGQVMPDNVAAWSQEALGHPISPYEFLNNPDLQLAIINYKLNQYWQQSLFASNGNPEVAILRVAAWWYCGKPDRYTSTRQQFYGGHAYPSIAEYSMSVLRRYERLLIEAQRPGNWQVTPAVSDQPSVNPQQVLPRT